MHHVGRIITLATNRAVLVFAETGEIERFAVEKKLHAGDFHGADSGGNSVGVNYFAVAIGAQQLNLELI